MEDPMAVMQKALGALATGDFNTATLLIFPSLLQSVSEETLNEIAGQLAAEISSRNLA